MSEANNLNLNPKLDLYSLTIGASLGIYIII